MDDKSPLDMDAETFRELGHKMVDQLADFIGGIREVRSSHSMTPDEAVARLPEGSIPEQGMDAEALLKEAIPMILSGSRVNGHPKSWGYIIGSPAPIGMLGDLLAATANPNLASWDSAPVPTEIELQTVRWIAELIGYPSDTGGLFVSGGNMANMVGFFAARRRAGGPDVRTLGMAQVGKNMVAYATHEAHTWIEKAADLCGLGTESIHWIETDDQQRMDLDNLRLQIDTDKAAGLEPFLIVGTAGSVSNGAVDPLPAMAEIAKERGLWLHVDGAYGGFAACASAGSVPNDIFGLRLADSVAVDAHKWLFTPLEAGVALVRYRQAMVDTFSFDPPYYHNRDEGEVTHFFRLGPQNSRCFRALKTWLILRQSGRKSYVETVERNLADALHMRDELLSTAGIEHRTQRLSINTFRYVPENGLPEDAASRVTYVNNLNKAIVTTIQRGGRAHISNAIMDGDFLLRACITNFRTREEDVRALPGMVVEEGRRIHKRMLGTVTEA